MRTVTVLILAALCASLALAAPSAPTFNDPTPNNNTGVWDNASINVTCGAYLDEFLYLDNVSGSNFVSRSYYDTVFSDTSGNYNYLTNYNASYNTTEQNMYFNGSAYLSGGNDSILQISNLTISFVARPESVTGIRGIISKYESTGNQRSYSVRQNSGAIEFVASVDGVNAKTCTVGSVFTINTTKLITVTYNGSVTKIYINNVNFANCTTVDYSTIFRSTAQLKIGTYAPTPNYFLGKLDNISIFNVVLTDNEILNLNDRINNRSNLVALYLFNNNSNIESLYTVNRTFGGDTFYYKASCYNYTSKEYSVNSSLRNFVFNKPSNAAFSDPTPADALISNDGEITIRSLCGSNQTNYYVDTVNPPAYYTNFSNNTITYSTCFQEQANVSTACGGLATGNYVNFSSAWYDGDYSTYAHITSDENRIAYVNYTVPFNAVSAKLQVKAGVQESIIDDLTCGGYLAVRNITRNFTVSTFINGKLQLKYNIARVGGNYVTSEIYYYNGSSWVDFANLCISGYFDFGQASSAIYEESIYWTLDNNYIDLSLNPNTIYYYGAACYNETYGLSNLTVRNYTYDATGTSINTTSTNEFNDLSGLRQGYSFYDDVYNLSFNFSDNYALQSYAINISDVSNGSQMSYVSNATLSGLTVVYSASVNVTTWLNGYYLVNITTTDNATNTQSRAFYLYRGDITLVTPSFVGLVNSTQSYTLNVTEAAQGSFTSANVTINGTTGANATKAAGSCAGSYCDFTSVLTAGGEGAETPGLSTYTWRALFTDAISGATSEETVSGTLTYYDYYVGVCDGTHTTQRINLSVFSEDTPSSPLSVSMEVYGNYTYDSVNYKILNLSFSEATSFVICAEPNFTFTMDFYAVYNSSAGFTHRFYLQNASLPVGVTNYSLYNYNDTTGKSALRITARDQDTYSYYIDLLGVLQRFYVAEGVWRTVQMDRTGDYGLLSFNIKELTTDYRIKYYDRVNNLLLTTQTVKFACSLGVCEATQLVRPYSSATASPTLSGNASYNNSTKIITATWTSSDPAGETVNFVVTHETMTGQSVACSDSQTGSGGTFTCNVSAYNSAFFTQLTDSDGAVFYNTLIEKIKTKIGQSLSIQDQSIYGFMIMVTVVALGLFSPVATLISSVVAMFFIFMFGLVTPLTLTLLIIGASVSFVLALRLRT